jgi:flagellar hook-length control protein FliK
VETIASDSVTAPSSAGNGVLFNLTGLLDTVSANAALSGVPATDAPPAALAVAALTANPSLVAAAVSKPLDVSSLSSVDAGLASLLMLKQTASKGLVASAEAKLPTSGPAADLANISLTLKFNNRTPEMAPLVQPVEPVVLALPAGELPLDGQTPDPVAAVHLDTVPVAELSGSESSVDGGLPAVTGQAIQTASVEQESALVALDALHPEQTLLADAAVQPIGIEPLGVVQTQPQGTAANAVTPVEVLTEVTVVLAASDALVAATPPDLLEPLPVPDATLAPPVLVIDDTAGAGGFKISLIRPDQALTVEPVAKRLPVSDGLGVLSVATDEAVAVSGQDQSVLAVLADGLKRVETVEPASTGTAAPRTSPDLSVLAQAAGLKISLASQATAGQKAGASTLSPLAATDAIEIVSGKDEPAKAHENLAQAPVIGQPVPAVDAMVQEQVALAAQVHGQPVMHPANRTATALSPRETDLAPVSNTQVTRMPLGASGVQPRDGVAGETNGAVIVSDQKNIQQIQQRDAESRDASDQQAGNRQADHQAADRRNDEAQAIKAKASDGATAGDNGFGHSDQSGNQGSQGKSGQGQGLAHDAPGVMGASGFAADESAGMNGVQAGSLASGSLTSKAILTVQYALSGSSAGRTGPATAAEMRFQSLGQQVLAALRNNAQEIELTLNPSQLGQVILKLNVDGSKVRVSAKTESKMTDEALKAGEEGLKASLLAQGFVLDGFDVSHDDDRRRAPKAESEGATVAQSTDGEAFSIDLIA